LERCLLKSSCLTSSERGTGILIFWISCSKLKYKWGFRISFTSGAGLLTIGGGFCASLSLSLSVIFLARFSALVGWSRMLGLPYFFLDLRLYLFGLVLVFSPFLSSFSWFSIRDSSYAN
jgi:hypothetical protein